MPSAVANAQQVATALADHALRIAQARAPWDGGARKARQTLTAVVSVPPAAMAQVAVARPDAMASALLDDGRSPAQARARA